MLEARADEKWGGKEDYEAYKSQDVDVDPKTAIRSTIENKDRSSR